MSVEEDVDLEKYIEEELDVSNDETEEINVVEEELEDNEVVERAKKYGHLSKEEWEARGNNPKDWKSPEEFDKIGKAIEQLYSLKKKVDQRDREFEAMYAYQQRTEQRALERAKQELEQQLAQSKNDMDMEGVSHYTKELVKFQDNESNSKAKQMQQEKYAAQTAFIERNQHWFNDRNPDLKNRAIEIDNEIKQKYPNASYDDLADIIEAKMIKEFPERVIEQRSGDRGSRISNTSSVNKTAVVKKHVFRNLSQEHKDTYNVYKRINPKVTEEGFIQKLKNEGEI